MTPAVKTTHAIVTTPATLKTIFSHTATFARSVIRNRSHSMLEVGAKIGNSISDPPSARRIGWKKLKPN
jgi:hypothetical protein